MRHDSASVESAHNNRLTLWHYNGGVHDRLVDLSYSIRRVGRVREISGVTDDLYPITPSFHVYH